MGKVKAAHSLRQLRRRARACYGVLYCRGRASRNEAADVPNPYKYPVASFACTFCQCATVRDEPRATRHAAFTHRGAAALLAVRGSLRAAGPRRLALAAGSGACPPSQPPPPHRQLVSKIASFGWAMPPMIVVFCRSSILESGLYLTLPSALRKKLPTGCNFFVLLRASERAYLLLWPQRRRGRRFGASKPPASTQTSAKPSPDTSPLPLPLPLPPLPLPLPPPPALAPPAPAFWFFLSACSCTLKYF